VTAVTIRITVFWVVTPCSVVERYQRFGGTCCIHFHSEDGKKASREYTGACLPKYKASHPGYGDLNHLAGFHQISCDSSAFAWVVPKDQSKSEARVCVS